MGSGTRFLIQQNATALFYKHPRQWVKDRTEGTDFHTSMAARAAIKALRLSGVSILKDFGNPELDVRLPPEY